MKTVSVIIPVYGNPDLRPLLDAVDEQEYSEWEVIVIDNNPTPTIQGLPSRVRVVHEPFPGSYAARNAGAACAHGDVLAFTDADCRPVRGWLTAGVTALGGQDNVLVGGPIVVETSADPTPAELLEERYSLPAERYLAEGYIVTANLFVARTTFDRLRGFDTRFRSGGDRDFCVRARDAQARLVFAPDAVVAHRARATSTEICAKARRVAAGSVRLTRKHDGSVVALILRSLKPPARRVRSLLRDRSDPLGVRLEMALISVAERLHDAGSTILHVVRPSRSDPRS